jgi:hypothetical protein
MTTIDPAFVMRVLAVFAISPNDSVEYLSWRTDGQYAPITFMANCSDDFYWGTGDCETITPDNIGELEQAVADVVAITGDAFGTAYFGVMLFCARLRGMRPQGASYPDDERLWPLFDACGPGREPGLGNPYRPGQYKPRGPKPSELMDIEATNG